MKALYTTLFSLLLVQTLAFAQSDSSQIKVKIAPTMATVEVNHRGTPVTNKRIRDTGNKLINDFAKISRPCPPFRVHPMESARGVATIGELNLLDFLDKEVAVGNGLLIDARIPEFYIREIIPASINIPLVLFTSSASDILPLLGVLPDNNGNGNFSEAKHAGLRCEEATPCLGSHNV